MDNTDKIAKKLPGAALCGYHMPLSLAVLAAAVQPGPQGHTVQPMEEHPRDERLMAAQPMAT